MLSDVGDVMVITHDIYGVEGILIRCDEDAENTILGWRNFLLMRLKRSLAQQTIS